MSASFFVVPQWQGSGSSRAMRLIDGAEAIRGDLPTPSTVSVEVPPDAGTDLGSGVHRLSAVQTVRDRLLVALRSGSGIPVVVGGDCGVELGAVQHALARDGVAVVWLDAHADLNTPESSPSGAFSGMVLRTLLGDGPASAVPSPTLDPSRLVLAGVRSLDDAESDFIAASGIAHLDPGALDPRSISTAVAATGATAVYVHLDLDVIDPAEFACVAAPEPFGVPFQMLLDVVAAIRATLPLVGAGITGFAPASPEAADGDATSILRVIGALTRDAPSSPRG